MKFFTCGLLAAATLGAVSLNGAAPGAPKPGFGVTKQGREDELSRIKEYELIDFEYNSDTNSLTFDAFGENYEILLALNEEIIGANVILEGYVPEDARLEIESMTESCHYYVLDIKESSNSLSNVGGGISMCNKRGLQAHFWYKDDSFTIKPAKHYFGFIEQDEESFTYSLTEQHLIFKNSQYDETGFPERGNKGIEAKGKGKGKNKNENKNKSHSKASKYAAKGGIKLDSDLHLHSHSRKLTQYNGGNNNIRVAVLADPGLYNTYYKAYGSSYYSYLYSYVQNSMNVMYSEYYNTNWGSSIGKLYPTFTGFGVVSSFSGNEAILKPDPASSSCTNFDSGCETDPVDYVYNLQSWVAKYYSSSSYDNFMIFSGYDMEAGTTGIAFVGVMCRSPTYSVSVNYACCGDAWWYKTIEHELGHNLGCPHDQDTTCGWNAGIMGYGSGYDFSSCSIASVNSHFSSNSYYMGCLASRRRNNRRRRRRMINDIDIDDGMDCDGYDCIRIEDITNDDYSDIINGEFIEEGCHNNNGYYKYTSDVDNKDYYLYNSNITGNWHIYTSLSDEESIGFCSETNLLKCGGRWYFDNNGEWEQQTDSISRMCFNDTNSTHGDGTNPYGDDVCIFNEGTLWNGEENGIATFTYHNIDEDGYPYFVYTYSSSNETIVYYLHYYFDDINGMSRWMISKNSLNDLTGAAYCEKEDLTDCTYGTWVVLYIDPDFEDEIMFEDEDSMGYTPHCNGDTSDSSDDNTGSGSGYCSGDNSCALWKSEIKISGSSSYVCGDTFNECFVETLYIDETTVEYSSNCVSNTENYVTLKIDFSDNENGGELYEVFMNKYSVYAQECASNDDSINTNIVSSNLTLCSNCQSFLGNSDDNGNSGNSESQDSGALHMFTSSNIIIFVVGVAALYTM